MKRVAIIGAGDLGRTLVAQLRDSGDVRAVAFFDDVVPKKTVCGLPVRGSIADVAAEYRSGSFDAALMGIGYKHLVFRAELFERLRGDGVAFATQIHPSCHIAGSAKVAQGSILFPGCTLDVGVVVGPNCLLNTGCTIAHDTRIAGHSFLGPGVTLAGCVNVEERCFLGVGSTVIDNIEIGAGAQTGGGAVVTRNVESGALVVGVPAEKIRSLE
jgi:sugar O-acyltransferase (sialic acid O-acetyltransferase NeuD family)